MAYGDISQTPSVGEQVTYVLSREERLKYNIEKIYPATIMSIHTPVSVDLSAVVTVPSLIAKSAPITSFSITSNVVTFIAANTFAAGDIVTISGLSVGTYLNGQNLTAVSPTGAQFTAAFTHADVGSTSDSGTAKQLQATLTPRNVSFGSSERNWFDGLTFSGVVPTGSPW